MTGRLLKYDSEWPPSNVPAHGVIFMSNAGNALSENL